MESKDRLNFSRRDQKKFFDKWNFDKTTQNNRRFSSLSSIRFDVELPRRSKSRAQNKSLRQLPISRRTFGSLFLFFRNVKSPISFLLVTRRADEKTIQYFSSAIGFSVEIRFSSSDEQKFEPEIENVRVASKTQKNKSSTRRA